MIKIPNITLALLTFVLFSGVAQSVQQPDFREARWGMTKAEVKRTEHSPLRGESKTSLVYQDSIAGIHTIVGYTFSSDGKQLIAGGYLSEENYKDRNMYLGDFRAMKQYLIGIYGQPEVDKVRWLNDFFKKDPEKRGFAVALGHVYYLTEWENENTTITMTLVGKDYKVQQLVSFKSKQYKEKLDYIRKNAEEIYKQKYSHQ